MADGTRCPDILDVIALLFPHLVQYRHDPVFEFAVIVVGHDQVAYPIEASLSQTGTVCGKIAEVGWAEAFDKVFLDATRCGDQRIHMLVLHQIPDHVAQAGRDEIRGVAEEDVTPRVAAHLGVEKVVGLGLCLNGLVGESPGPHLIHYLYRSAQLGRLEADGGQA